MEYNELYRLLKANRIAEVLPAVKEKAAVVGNWEVTEDIDRIWTTYQQMLQFMLSGVNDPQSQTIRSGLCYELLQDVARLERLDRIKNRPSEKYVSIYKEQKNVPSFEWLVARCESVASQLLATDQDELLRDTVKQHRLQELEQENETVLVQLFHWTWTSGFWQNGDIEQANRILFSEHIGSEAKAVFVSAVTLSLLEFIDPVKVQFLFDAYLTDDQLVAQRCLVGIVLMLYLHFDLLSSHDELLQRLAAYCEDSTFVQAFYSTMMQLQLCCNTESVSSRMRNDIIPAIMQGKIRKDSERPVNLDDLTKHGENPEWMKNDQVDKKMHEMAELQMSGADIYYSSFSMLKGYPFFNLLPHWFYPFSFNNTLVPELKQVLSGKIGKMVRMMLKGSPFCNSDKYSLCFTFRTLGTFAEDAVETQINQQLNGENLDDLIDEAEQSQLKPVDIRRQYIFDLYRFFFSYPYKNQFVNPFVQLKEKPITPYSNPWLRTLLSEVDENKEQYADFLMRQSFYEAALQLFDSLPKNEFEDRYASLWQKIGFCHQKSGHTEEALRAYTVADTIKPNSKWTLTHLATLSSYIGKYADAAQYYKELLELHPDSTRYLQLAAQSLMQDNRFDEALQLVYKLAYLEDTDDNKRLLSWCLIAVGKKEEAAAQLQDLMQGSGIHDVRTMSLQAVLLLVDNKPREAYNLLHSIDIDDTLRKQIKRQLHVLAHLQIVRQSMIQLFLDALILHID